MGPRAGQALQPGSELLHQLNVYLLFCVCFLSLSFVILRVIDLVACLSFPFIPFYC